MIHEATNLELVGEEELDLESIAADFIEEEVGRKDWANNWAALKANNSLEAKVKSWMIFQQIEGDPTKIISHIDNMVAQRGTESWR